MLLEGRAKNASGGFLTRRSKGTKRWWLHIFFWGSFFDTQNFWELIFHFEEHSFLQSG